MLFTMIFPLFPKDLLGHPIVTNLAFILVKILLLPVVAGISYEIIRFADKANNKILNALLLPGMWLQQLTTREPSDDQIEVALVALRMTLEKEQSRNTLETAA
jgi:uncharacterized protein YqhQ